MLRKLDIVVILARDWPKAVEWYTSRLGLKVLYREDDDQWCQLAFPEGDTKLAILHDDRPDQSSGQRCIPDILVNELSATVEELKRRGVEFRGPIRGGDEGFRIVTLLDPEGNELQLYEWRRKTP